MFTLVNEWTQVHQLPGHKKQKHKQRLSRTCLFVSVVLLRERMENEKVAQVAISFSAVVNANQPYCLLTETIKVEETKR